MTNKDFVLCSLLDCGTADLELLEKINYDLENIISELSAEGILSLEGICHLTFRQAAQDLQDKFENLKNDIRFDILNTIENDKKDLIESGIYTKEELENTDEYQELLSHLNLLDDGIINPEEDITYYFNYLDTHIYIKHIDFYRKWMERELDIIENNMGWSFEEG